MKYKCRGCGRETEVSLEPKPVIVICSGCGGEMERRGEDGCD